MAGKVLVVIQSRFGSARLPGKVMRPLCGIPMLAFLLRRFKEGPLPETCKIVLATTTDKEDDIIESCGRENGIKVVRGESEDVLKRYIQCLEQYPADIVVRVTADNPLTSVDLIRDGLDRMEGSDADYVKPEGYPKGTGVDLFRADALKVMDRDAKAPKEREHINLFILNHPERFRIRSLQAVSECVRPELNMSVDTEQDLIRVNSLFEPHETEPWRISVAEAIRRMDSSSARKQ